MKFFIVTSFCVAVVVAQTRIPAKPVTRKLPADVLRDFPGACFASTACRVFQPTQSWPLKPFCGKATCLQDGSVLLEQVEDCGPRPKESPGCRIVNEADLEKDFPTCCPIYECAEGASLQYPTKDELAAAAAAAAAAGQGNQSGQSASA